MTKEGGEEDTLAVYKTPCGDHKRERMNQRQIDVLLGEVLPRFEGDLAAEVGVITPYRAQKEAVVRQMGNREIEVDTVHKFQGREKDSMILTTVDDVVTEFSDDPYLLNVAVSRAKKRFLLITSANEQPKDSNIRDLIAYVEYNRFEVAQSQIYSIFDLLYRQYTDQRIEFLKRHGKVSRYDSENLMYGLISDLLRERSRLSLGLVCHAPLRMLFRDVTILEEEEKRYVEQTASHVDFLIYRRIGRVPVLGIEVDGFHFHKPGTAQFQRDRLKEKIFEKFEIPFRRYATNGSGEMEDIRAFLDEYERESG